MAESENPNYLNETKASKEFRIKPFGIQKRINEALYILDKLGIPINKSPRSLERMALVFLAVADITAEKNWSEAVDFDNGRNLRTRDIINFINTNLHDNISSGSYDDIRRKDLKPLVLQGIIIQTNPSAASNDPTRGYALNPEYAGLIRSFGANDWQRLVEEFISNKTTLSEKLSAQRRLQKTPVILPSGVALELDVSQHNQLQKAIIEEFLPRFGFNAEVLYVGDTSNKTLFFNRERFAELTIPEPRHGKLPDIIAYSNEKNWLYVIEAVYSSGPISAVRLLELKELLRSFTSDIIFVTAFLEKRTFLKFATEIAWETEVWLASDPDHLIHFDGDKFLGGIK